MRTRRVVAIVIVVVVVAVVWLFAGALLHAPNTFALLVFLPLSLSRDKEREKEKKRKEKKTSPHPYTCTHTSTYIYIHTYIYISLFSHRTFQVTRSTAPSLFPPPPKSRPFRTPHCAQLTHELSHHPSGWLSLNQPGQSDDDDDDDGGGDSVTDDQRLLGNVGAAGDKRLGGRGQIQAKQRPMDPRSRRMARGNVRRGICR